MRVWVHKIATSSLGTCFDELLAQVATTSRSPILWEDQYWTVVRVTFLHSVGYCGIHGLSPDCATRLVLLVPIDEPYLHEHGLAPYAFARLE